jgi:hypothetical protein
MNVDFLARVLAHICDVQIAGQSVKAISPLITESKRPDLIVTGNADEWIGGGDRVIRNGISGEVISVHIDPQHLAAKIIGDVLGIPVGIVARATVT